MGRYQEGVWDEALREAERRRRPTTSPLRLVLVLMLVLVVVMSLFAYLYATGRLGFLDQRTGNPSYKLTFSGETNTEKHAVFIVNVTVSAPAALTTGMTGLRLVSPTNLTLVPGAAPGACDSGTPFDQCLAASSNLTGWIALLMTLAGDVLASYPSPGGSTSWSSSLVTFIDAGSIAILSPVPLAGTNDTLEAFGTGASTVTGTMTL